MGARIDPATSHVAHIPTRTCVGCRRRAPRGELVRVVAPDGVVRADPSARAQGRGAWLCRDEECLDGALRRGGAPLRRALRQPGATLDHDQLAATIRGITGAAPPHAVGSARTTAPHGTGQRQTSMRRPRPQGVST